MSVEPAARAGSDTAIQGAYGSGALPMDPREG